MKSHQHLENLERANYRFSLYISQNFLGSQFSHRKRIALMMAKGEFLLPIAVTGTLVQIIEKKAFQGISSEIRRRTPLVTWISRCEAARDFGVLLFEE